MSGTDGPRARPGVEARLLQLTDEIDQLRVELGQKLDEAAALMKRISLVDETNSHQSIPATGEAERDWREYKDWH